MRDLAISAQRLPSAKPFAWIFPSYEAWRAALAVARYRLLTNLRRANYLFVTALITIVGPQLLTAIAPSEAIFVQFYPELQQRLLIVTYAMQSLLLLGACSAFGTVRHRQTSLEWHDEGAGSADLMDTVPVRAGVRFWGDALGIFAAVMVIHICTLPLLALAAALAPSGTAPFVVLEIFMVAIVLLASIGASWKLRTGGTGWSHTRTARTIATFLTLFLIVLNLNTRWNDFRDAWAGLVNDPSPVAWQALVESVNDPLLFWASILALYFGFILFFYLQSVRVQRD